MRRAVSYFIFATFFALFFVVQSHHNTAFAQAPSLRRILPDAIPAGSATFTLRLQGKFFSSDAKILFDGQPLASSRIATKGRVLIAEVDAAAVATVGNHTVQARNGDGTLSQTFTLEVVPSNSSVRLRLEGNATQEDPGTDLLFEVSGEGFNENTKAFTWGVESPNTTFISDTRLVVQISLDILDVPARIPIFVRTGNGRFSNAENFFVVARPATLSFLEPDSTDVGSEDTEVVVRGNFKPGAQVLVNGTPVDSVVKKDGRLVITLPAALLTTPQQIFIRVEQEGVQSRDEVFTVTPESDPIIFTIAPLTVRVGEKKPTIDITGANLGDKATVLVDGQEVNIRTSTKTRLSAVIPLGLTDAPGTHTVQVKSEDGKVTQTFTFVVVPDSQVATLAGDNREGFATGCVSAEASHFRRPRRIAVGPDRFLYVTDQQNHAIRRINPNTGEVCTIAGSGESGYHDSSNSAGSPITFSFPNGVAVASNGTIYVTENGNDVVRRLVRNGSSIVADTIAGTIEEVTARARQEKLNATKIGLEGFRDGAAGQGAFRNPDEIVVAPDGSLYFTDPNNHAVRRLRPNGTQFIAETVAGNGVPGFIDGISSVARFNTPTGLGISPDGSLLYVADTGNNRVRRINLQTGKVTTLAGTGDFGADDGPGIVANFGQPIGIAVSASGIVYVSELGNGLVRRVDPQGNTSTIAGGNGRKLRDGAGLNANFNAPRGIAIDGNVIYVADYENFRIRKITLP